MTESQSQKPENPNPYPLVGFRIKAQDMPFFKIVADMVYQEGRTETVYPDGRKEIINTIKKPNVADLARYALYMYSKAYVINSNEEHRRRAQLQAQAQGQPAAAPALPYKTRESDVISEDV